MTARARAAGAKARKSCLKLRSTSCLHLQAAVCGDMPRRRGRRRRWCGPPRASRARTCRRPLSVPHLDYQWRLRAPPCLRVVESKQAQHLSPRRAPLRHTRTRIRTLSHTHLHLHSYATSTDLYFCRSGSKRPRLLTAMLLVSSPGVGGSAFERYMRAMAPGERGRH